MTHQLLEHLKQLIVEQLDVRFGSADIDEQTPLFDGGMELDSFAIIELITLIEKEYAFEFTDVDLRPENFVNLRSVADLVHRRAANEARDRVAS